MKSQDLDTQDLAILAYRTQCFWQYERTLLPRVGDYIVFADEVTRRVSHVWDWPTGGESVQTSDGGSFYLGEGYCSFSGGLYPGIPLRTLTLTADLRQGPVWFFHHDLHRASNAVSTTIPCAVYTCTLRSDANGSL